MNYIDKIVAYDEGSMSVQERVAFEYELADNATLKQEWEAYQLSQDLLGFTAVNIVAPIEVTTLDSTTMLGAKEARWTTTCRYILGAMGLLVLCSVLYTGFNYLNAEKSDTIPQSSLEQVSPTNKVEESIFIEAEEKEISVPNIEPTPKKVQNTKAAVAPIAQLTPPKAKKPIKEIKRVDSIISSTVATPRVAMVVQPTEKKKLIAASVLDKATLKEITSNTSIASGEVLVLEAKNSITLQPGFVVEAGASFNAVIKSNR